MDGSTTTPLPMSLRTAQGEADYQRAKQTGETKPLADEKHIKEYVYWVLIPNRYPPKVAFKTSHMLLPRRAFPDWQQMSSHEFIELQEIVQELSGSYDQLTMNMPHNRSVKGHFHLHLNKFYDDRKDMSL